MKKNVASQSIGAQMITASDGSAFTGSVTVYVTGDAGTQAIGSVGSGACTHEGNGYHTYAPAQAETNYDLVAFTFIGTGAIPATVQVYTDFPQTGDSYARIGAPVGASISADIAVVDGNVDSVLADTGTDGVVVAAASKTGYSLTATTGLGNQTADITGSLSGSVGSVTGAVGSVTAGVTVTTNNDKTGYALSAAGVDGIWDEATVGHVTAGTYGVAVTDILADTNELQADDYPTTLATLATSAEIAALNDPTAAAIADAVWDEALAGHLGAGSTGNALNAAGAAGDPWSTAIPGAYGAGTAGYIVGNNLDAAVSGASTHSAADVWAVATRVLTAGTNLNDLSTADIDARLAAIRLDELLAADSDIDGLAPPTVGSVFHELMSKTTGSFTFDQTTDSLEALRDRGDAAWTTATSVTVSDKTGFSLAADQSTVTIGTCTTNTDMRGTDSAALASVCTEGRLAELDAANIPADVDTINTATGGLAGAAMRGTDSAATAAALATAQADLDLITGADGATLATAQGNYAPAVAGDAMALTSGERDSTAAAIFKLDLSALSGEARRSLLNAIRPSLNKVSVSGGVVTVYKEDDTTAAYTAAATTDAAAEPIIAVDPV